MEQGEAREPPPTAECARDGVIEPAKPLILIIEDDVWTRSIAGELLEAEGFTVARAADGQAGLGLAQRLNPAVILLDLGLPRMSGREFLMRFRSRPAVQRTPVIALSGQAEPASDSVVSLADRVLRKPVDVTQLIELVQQAVTARYVTV
jgi:two-component system, OmpR family, phosphate regulon response regulator PhoB